MTEENLKETLLDLMKEAENLPESELEIIPGTRIRVKKGKVDEFKANARFYYQFKNNVMVNNDDYIKEVYYELSDELAKDAGEHVLDQAYDLYQLGKNELERITVLNNALKTNKGEQEKYQKQLNDLKERNLSNISTSKEMESLQRTITELQNIEIQLRKVLSEAILGLKNKINEAVKKNTEQEMAFIRENVTKMPKGTKTAHSILDGNLILEKDAEYYDNLYILSKIIDNVKDDLPLINVGDVIWVNPEQLDSAKELVNKIDFLKLVKKEEVADIQKEKPNNKKLIENINAELDRLRPTIDTVEKDKKEYDNLIQIVRYLNRADNYNFELMPVWDVAYIVGEDRNTFTRLLRQTTFFDKYNPDLPKIEENEKIISELRNELERMEDEVRKDTSPFNVATKKVGNAIIFPKDEEEYKNILAIIDILQNSRENLIHTSKGGNISSDMLPKYNELISKTKYFTPQIEVEKIEIQNEPVITKLEQEVENLKKEDNPENRSQIDLLNDQINIISHTDASKETTEINGVIVNKDDAKDYNNIVNDLAQAQVAPIMDVEPKPIEPIVLDSENAVIQPDPTLDNASNNSFILINNDEPSASTPDHLEPSKEEGTSLAVRPPLYDRSKVIKVRKLTKKEWWQKNWKTVVGIGLAMGVAALSLSALAPSLIYFFSSLTQAAPALASLTGPMNNALAIIGNVSASALNYQASAATIAPALLESLVKIGVIGGGFAISKKAVFNMMNSSNITKEKIDGEVVYRISEQEKETLLERVKSIGKEMVEKAKEFSENLIDAIDDKRVALAGNTLNAQMETRETEDIDQKYNEIHENVERQIDAEENAAIADRINERFNRIKNGENPLELPPHNPTAKIVIPSEVDILSELPDVDLELGRLANYVDLMHTGNFAGAKIYQKAIFDSTGIDLSNYDMNNPAEIRRAEEDIRAHEDEKMRGR